MIYQHRLVIARRGKLEDRHQHFQNVAMQALDEHGSRLIGAWEIWIGPDAGSGIWQVREHDSLASWEEHRRRAVADTALRKKQNQGLYPALDFVDTSILELADFSPELQRNWPEFDAVRGKPRGVIEQRTLYFKPDLVDHHHELYANEIKPALEYGGAELLAFFDTVIGPGTTNTASHRSVELRWFPDMMHWQTWRDAQDQNTKLSQLVKREWLGTIERVDSVLLRPMDYSLIR